MVAAGLRLVEATDPPYGLIRTAQTAAQGDTVAVEANVGFRPAAEATSTRSTTRWPGGFYIERDPCGGGSLIDPCGDLGAGATGDDTVPEPIGPIQPFVAEAAVSCFSNIPQAEMEARATRQLEAVRSWQLEREFWAGTAAQAGSFNDNQWLTKDGAVPIDNNAAIGYVTALAELEQAIANGSTWAVGFIHAMPRTVALWSQNGLVTERRPGVYTTLLGTFVVAGRGYPGTGTGEEAAHLGTYGGQYAYAYATSQVFVFLGQVAPAVDGDNLLLDRTENTIIARAYQPLVAAWDGCIHASALVDHATALTAIGS